MFSTNSIISWGVADLYLLPEINSKQTKNNARKVLNPYRRLARIAGRSLTDIKSPAITGMPKSSSFDNSKEIKNTNVLSATMEVDEIEHAVFNMSRDCLEVIYYTYMSKNYHTKTDISGLVFGSIAREKTVDRRLSEGLLQFCESYKGGSLLVFKSHPNDQVSIL